MNAPLRLFALFVGGAHERALIELHDVQFVIARSVEESYPLLRQLWWGKPASLHIDATAEIETVDGYDVIPAPGGEGGDLSLYFVNTGGYEPGVFGENHAYSFHVGRDKRAIWAAAKARAHFSHQHQDNFDTIDDIICIDDHLRPQNYALNFRPAANKPDAIRIEIGYKRLPEG